MKKLILSGFVAGLALPCLALAAAYNDVTLSGGTVLSVNGITINVSGATLNSITTDVSTFSVILAPQSSITVSAPNFNQLSPSTSAFTTASECDGGGSSLTLSAGAGAATTTVTVTPSSTLCKAPLAQSGGYYPVTNVTAPPTTSTSTATTSSNVLALATTTASTTVVVATSTVGNTPTVSGLQAQLNALLAQIAALSGNSLSSTGTNGIGASFPRDLKVGSKGADVKALQVWLNTHGYVVAATGPGSPGKETAKFGNATKAVLKKFQKAVGINPATGYFGAKTRAYIQTHQ